MEIVLRVTCAPDESPTTKDIVEGAMDDLMATLLYEGIADAAITLEVVR